MQHDHVTVTFECTSAFPRDRIVNTFAFSGDPIADPADLATIEANLNDFYNVMPVGGSHPLSYYISGAISRSVKPVIRHYNVDGFLGGAAAGSPIRTTDMAANLGAPGGTGDLPSECAAVLTLKGNVAGVAEFAPGARPRARHRGHIFLGPLSNATLVTSSGRTQLDPALLSNATKAGLRLITAAGPDLAAWSRKDGAFYPITSCYMDDAYDTQRRRGPRAATRVTLP